MEEALTVSKCPWSPHMHWGAKCLLLTTSKINVILKEKKQAREVCVAQTGHTGLSRLFLAVYLWTLQRKEGENGTGLWFTILTLFHSWHIHFCLIGR